MFASNQYLGARYFLILAVLLFYSYQTVEAHGHHHHHHHETENISLDPEQKVVPHFLTSTYLDIVSHFMSSKLSLLFPQESPLINSFLATFYISAIPNILLLFVPKDLKPSNLNVLVSFAVGGLLGDVFLHLLPHCFQENYIETYKLGHAQLTIRNIFLGIAAFVGFLAFYILDKVMRIFTGSSGHSHSHSHDKAPVPNSETVGSSSAISKKVSDVRKRKKGDTKNNDVTAEPCASSEVKSSAYLNLIADFSHNFTDGLAIASSFYFSKSIGISTTLAVFFHEIPHEIGDFAILLQAGFTRSSAMYSQFFTAIGAFLGTAVGVAIQELLSSNQKDAPTGFSFNIFPVPISDLVLPLTAGGFLYIATTSVIPELLEIPADISSKKNRKVDITSQLFQFIKEITAMLLGVLLMALVSLAE